jgi:hypothetical protein
LPPKLRASESEDEEVVHYLPLGAMVDKRRIYRRCRTITAPQYPAAAIAPATGPDGLERFLLDIKVAVEPLEADIQVAGGFK